MILKNGVELSMHGLASSTGSHLAEKLSQYAAVLASQGCIETAMNYLSCTSAEDVSDLYLIFHSVLQSTVAVYIIIY